MAKSTVSIASLQEQAQLLTHQTPYFYTSKQLLKHNYGTYLHLFDDADVYYALKANSDPKVLTYLASLGAGFEAASAFEIKLLIDLGVDPERIIYGTSIKPAEHIKVAFEAGITRYAADSMEEVKKLADNAPGSKVYIRTIVDDSGSVFMMSERFGTPADTVKDMIVYARKLGLKTYGISFYVGSQAAHADMWARGVDTVRPIVEDLLKDGIRIEAINIGGGFPVPYDNHQDAPQLADIVAKVHKALHKLPYIPKIIMEPGRGIVATTTVLVSEVIARNDRGNKPWLCMDAGIYNALYEAMIHQGSTRYPIAPLNPPIDSTEELLFTIAGPTGDSLDIVARDVRLPAYIDVGDKLVFQHAGAYTVTMASPFNGFPPPPLYIS